MGSTELLGADAIVPLSAADVGQATELSKSAHWNQNPNDWSMMLALGHGYGIHAVDEQGTRRLAASVVVLPYEDRFAWVSMVLVLPAFQRRGLASMLLRHALAGLRANGMAAVLDATPAGHDVYVQEGFTDTWGFARFRREAGAAPPLSVALPVVRALRDSDWPDIAAIDATAFGASRLPLLRALAARWPQACRVVAQGCGLSGVMFGRDGREAHQIGPLLADDSATAGALLGAALRSTPGAVYLDLVDARKADWLPWLQQQGFVFQRPFTRMVWGTDRAPGDPRRIWAVAGPELG